MPRTLGRGSKFCPSWPGWGVEPCKGDVTLWRELLDFLFHGADAAHREWFERWCAYPIQHPGAKMKSTLVIHGPQGTGKNMFFEAFSAA